MATLLLLPECAEHSLALAGGQQTEGEWEQQAFETLPGCQLGFLFCLLFFVYVCVGVFVFRQLLFSSLCGFCVPVLLHICNPLGCVHLKWGSPVRSLRPLALAAAALLGPDVY